MRILSSRDCTDPIVVITPQCINVGPLDAVSMKFDPSVSTTSSLPASTCAGASGPAHCAKEGPHSPLKHKMHLLADWKPMLSTLFPQVFAKHYCTPESNGDVYSTYFGEDLDLILKINEAAASGRKAELECLLGKDSPGANMVNKAFDVWNTSTLYCACLNGSAACVKLLLERNHRVDAGNHFGTSPLEIAAMRDHGEVVFELLVKGKASLTAEAVSAAAQWNRRAALSAMYCAGALKKEFLDLGWRVATERRHVELMEVFASMRTSSPVEFAANAMNLPALRRFANRAEEGVILPTLMELRKALPALGRSKVKMLRPSKDFRECKDLISSAQKYIMDMSNALLRVRLKNEGPVSNDDGVKERGELLALKAPKVMSILFQYLGFVEPPMTAQEDNGQQQLTE